MDKKAFILASCLAVGLLGTGSQRTQGVAAENPQYVGTEKCTTCHADLAKKWALTAHRATLYNQDPALKGCEACHGPGSKHVEGGGGAKNIIMFDKIKLPEIVSVCTKCHSEEHVTLWQSSVHGPS